MNGSYALSPRTHDRRCANPSGQSFYPHHVTLTADRTIAQRETGELLVAVSVISWRAGLREEQTG